MNPNLIIFRVPDVDGSKTFLQLPLDEDGNIQMNDQACEFTVIDGDSYNQLAFNQVVLAVSQDDVGSLELARIDIVATVGGQPVEVYADPFQVAIMARSLMEDWKALPAAEGDAA